MPSNASLAVDSSVLSLAEVKQGDAFDLVDTVSEDSVDLVLTSPPFWGLRSYGLDHSDEIAQEWIAQGGSTASGPDYFWYRGAAGILGLEPYPHWYVSHLIEFFARIKRILKRTGSVWVNLGDTYFARWGSIRDNGRQGFEAGRRRRRTPSGGYLCDKQMLLIPARFAIAMQDEGWVLRNDLIWHKPNVLPRPELDRLRLSHEHWFHFVLRQPRGRPRYFYDIGSCEAGSRDVVICLTANGKSGHTATFPPALIRPRILSSCPVGGLMLDPFCGTGRAIVECLSVGRRGLGFEISQTYATLAATNIAAALAGRGRQSNEQSDSRRQVLLRKAP